MYSPTSVRPLVPSNNPIAVSVRARLRVTEHSTWSTSSRLPTNRNYDTTIESRLDCAKRI
jgi:hypothetical protein